MYISRHGGHCCGIKHIYGFTYPPTSVVAADNTTDSSFSSDHCHPGETVKGIGPCPKETAEARFVRTICWLEDRRPSGIIEVVLASQSYGGRNAQLVTWPPVLRKYGFVRVTPKDGVENSNSGNRLHVYHRYSGLKKKLKLPPTPEIPEAKAKTKRLRTATATAEATDDPGLTTTLAANARPFRCNCSICRRMRGEQ